MTPTLRRLLLVLTIMCVVVLVAVPFNPVVTGFRRLVQLAAAGGFWLGMVILVWRWKAARTVGLALPLLAGGFLLLPGRSLDGEELRADYVRELRSLDGVPYFWGGESGSGIDCSGLPRRALRQALLSQALRHGDAGAFREFGKLWLRDTSARAMSEGYRGFTRDLGIQGRIADMDYGTLRPGDLAVTEGGAHVLVFLGGEDWIQADPGPGRVLILNGHRDASSWFQYTVSLHRWSVLP